MRRCLYLSICVLLCCLSPLHGQQSADNGNTSAGQREPERQIIALEHRYWEAWKMRDAKTLAQIRAEDFREADHDGIWDKKQTEEGDLDLETTAFRISNEKVSVLQPDVALLTYEAAYKESYKGKDISSSHSYIASLYERRKGDWRLVYTQESLANDSQATEKAAVSSKPPDDQFFIEKEKEDWEALKHKDKAAATRFLADDFVGMYDFGFFNKSEWVKQIDDDYAVDDYTIMNPKVVHPTPTTALLLYTSTCKGTGAWAEFCSHEMRISDLMVERNGEWLALFSQDTTATNNQQDDASALKEILASENRIVAALSRNDIEGFANLLPEDVIDIDGDGVHTKAEWITEFEQYKNKGFLYRDFRFENPKLVRLGPDQATFTAKEIIHGLDVGKPFELRYSTNATYVRRNGKWMPRVYQDTPTEK